jgi:hypothetical protein
MTILPILAPAYSTKIPHSIRQRPTELNDLLPSSLTQLSSSSTPEQINLPCLLSSSRFSPRSYALFTVYGGFGLNYSSALVATLASLGSRTIMLWMAVVFTGSVPQFAPQALWVLSG